jgi:hypothetical protein
VYVSLGRLRRHQGDGGAAREAYRTAESVIRRIAASVEDAALQQGLLASSIVREVIQGSRSEDA